LHISVNIYPEVARIEPSKKVRKPSEMIKNFPLFALVVQILKLICTLIYTVEKYSELGD